MISKLQSLKIWQKLSLVALLLAVPIVTLLAFFVREHDERLAATDAELAGLQYLTPLRRTMELVAQHRTAAYAALNGDAAARASLGSITSRVDAAFSETGAIDLTLGAPWQTTPSWTRVRDGWARLRAEAMQVSARESYARHTQLTNELTQHLRLVADRARLSNDPQLDSYYLADALLTPLTWSGESIGQLRALAAAISARGTISADDLAQVQTAARQVTQNWQMVDRNLESAFRYQANLRPRLAEKARGAGEAAAQFARQIEGDTAEGRPRGGPAWETTGSGAAQKAASLADEVQAALADLLQARRVELRDRKYQQLSLVLVVAAVAALLVYFISSRITLQIGNIMALMREINVGNYRARCEAADRDELGDVARSINAMLDNTVTLIQSREERDRIQRSIQKLLNEVADVAEGDLTREAEVTADVTGAIADAFNYMTTELRNIIQNVQRTTLEVSASAAQVQQTATDLAQGSQVQSTQISHASSAIGEMARSIQQVSDSASKAAQVAQQALENARGGAETVRKTMEGMNSIRGQVQETAKRIKRLGESSQEIGEIVELIGDIADRTSILALNASIQAAMAGDSGKGFAVVAEEVERLAERAAESTKKISALIKSVQGDTTEAVAAMEETTREVVSGSRLATEAGQRLADIERVSHQIAELVQEISRASQEQARGSDAVSRNVNGISQFTQRTAAGAQQAEASIRRLSTLAHELNESLRRFKLPAAR